MDKKSLIKKYKEKVEVLSNEINSMPVVSSCGHFPCEICEKIIIQQNIDKENISIRIMERESIINDLQED